MPTPGKRSSASHAPPPTNPAVFGLTSQATPVTSKTANEASRHGRYNPPRRSVCASITSGERHAMKSRMWLRSITSFRFATSGGSRTSKADETQSHHLPRRDFLLGFLGAARVGRIEEALQWPGRFRMEDRAHGCIRFSEIDRASRLVLSAERNDDAFALYAQAGLVRAEFAGMPGAEFDRGSRARSRRG